MKPERASPGLSPAQLEVMNLVWDRGEITVGELWDYLSSLREISRNTVQTTMTRLEEKGWLKHRTVGQTFVYSAARERGDTLQGLVNGLVDSAFGGSVEGLMMALLHDRSLTPKEATRIQSLIDQARKRRRRQ